MVHVYQSPDYEYYFAPVGLECTVVAIKMAQGKFYSSFTPITITPNQVVNFSFTETTADEFIDAIDALN